MTSYETKQGIPWTTSTNALVVLEVKATLVDAEASDVAPANRTPAQKQQRARTPRGAVYPSQASDGDVRAANVIPRDVARIPIKFSTDAVDLSIKVHFRPFRIPLGKDKKITFFFASTGAFITAEVTGGTFTLWSKQAKRDMTSTVEERVATSIEFNPKPKVKVTGAGTADISFGGFEASHESRSQTQFEDAAQQVLTDKCIGETLIEWQYVLNRAAKPVRDFLDETLALGVRHESGRASPWSVTIGVELDDASFYSAGRKPLGGFKAAALKLRLARNGVVLPRSEKVVIVCRSEAQQNTASS